MKYVKVLTYILFALTAAPALAATGPFDLLRGSDPSTVRMSAVFDTDTASPFNDTGTLTDGNDYFYLVRDALGEFVDLTLDKDRTADRVQLSFDDIPSPPAADPGQSTVTVSPASILADGVSAAMVTIVPKDVNGLPIGSGLLLSLDPTRIAPGTQSGSVQDMGDGTYIVYVVSTQIGQGVVEVEVGGTILNAQPGVQFQSVLDSDFQVNVSATGNQSQPAVGQATNGGSVTVWQGADVDGYGIIGRVFNADGSLVGGEFTVNTTTTGDQTSPSVAVAADRSFVVAWQGADVDGSGIYAQLFDAAGQPVGGEILVNLVETGGQRDPHAIMADDGSFVVVWQGPDSQNDGVHARMFDAFGQPVSNEFLINTDESGNQDHPQAAMTSDGRFLVLWQTTSGFSQGIYAQLYNAAGAPVGTETRVKSGLNGLEGLPRIAMSGTGAFTVVWQDSDGSGVGIVSRPYDEFGLPLTPGVLFVNTTINGKQDQPDVAMDDSGQSLVVWRNNSSGEIRGQRFDTTAAPLGNEILVSDPSASSPKNPVASLAGDGSNYIVLYEALDGDGTGIFASWVPLM